MIRELTNDLLLQFDIYAYGKSEELLKGHITSDVPIEDGPRIEGILQLCPKNLRGAVIVYDHIRFGKKYSFHGRFGLLIGQDVTPMWRIPVIGEFSVVQEKFIFREVNLQEFVNMDYNES